MTDLPASGYWSDNNRTEGEQKQWGEDIRDFLNQMPGGGLEETVTISSGSVTPTRGIIAVDTEGGTASDTLDVIAQASLPEGSLILVRAANASRTVTVTHNSGSNGSVLLKSGADEDLAVDQFLWLKRTGATWEEVSQRDSKLAALPRDLLPDADGTRNFGSASKSWAEAHADKVLTDNLVAGKITDPNDDTRFVAVDPYVIEGVPRAGGNIDQDLSSNPITNDFNVSSTTDNGSGLSTVGFTNSFDNADFMVTATANGTGGIGFAGPQGSTGRFVTSVELETQASDGSNFPARDLSIIVHGPLA